VSLFIVLDWALLLAQRELIHVCLCDVNMSLDLIAALKSVYPKIDCIALGHRIVFDSSETSPVGIFCELVNGNRHDYSLSALLLTDMKQNSGCVVFLVSYFVSFLGDLFYVSDVF